MSRNLFHRTEDGLYVPIKQLSESELWEREKQERKKQKREYRKQHCACPKCESGEGISQTCMMPFEPWPEDRTNRADCCLCGWSGVVHDLVEEKS